MIIFGLGNPGIEFRSTRHNIGYMFLDQLARLYKKRFRAYQGYRMTRIIINREIVKLVKPTCWMNQSGHAISAILQTASEDFLVVVDDINLPLGKIRLRSKGSDGGHLGLRSIINSLGNSHFPRLRIGISAPVDDVTLYVLERFNREEKERLIFTINKGIKGVKVLVTKGFQPAQNFINAINLSKDI